MKPGKLISLGLEVVKLLGRIKTRDPKVRAKSMRGRARLLHDQADALKTEMRRHELSSRNGSKKTRRFHARKQRQIGRRIGRIDNRAWWWSRQAERINPQ